MDDIKQPAPASEGVKAPPAPAPRTVGPESEVRGGPEAPDEDDDTPE